MPCPQVRVSGAQTGGAFALADHLAQRGNASPVHVHDLNATLLHLLGLNHLKLTYRLQGRDYRLTDVHGNVVQGILA